MSATVNKEHSVGAEATPYHPLSTAEPTEDLDQTNQQPTSPSPFDKSARNRFVNLKQRTLYEWRWETLSCVLTVAALLAIVGTIFPYQGKAKPGWPNTISLNTLLAIYTVILKSSFVLVVGSSISQLQWIWFTSEQSLFDIVRYNAAKSDIWGSLQWLWAHRFRQPLTALGAIMTVVAVSIDPFTQQLLSYVDCSEVLDGFEAALPRTNYFKGHGVEFVTPVFNDEEAVSIEPGLQAAINAGLFGAPYAPVAECLSGNCTFAQTYATVGYCSKCEDISYSISIINETCYNIDQNDNRFPQPCFSNSTAARITSEIPGNGLQTSMNVGNLSVTWDNSFISDTNTLAAMLVMSPDPELPHAGDIFYQTQLLIGKTAYSLQRIDPAGSGPIAGCTGSSGDDLWQCRGYGAARCSLNPCIREYTASVDSGKLQETLIRTTDPSMIWGISEQTDGSPGTLALIDTHCTTAAENAQLLNQSYKLNTTRWIPYNVTAGYHTTPASAPFTRCVFSIDYLFASDLYNLFLMDFFNGSLVGITGFDSGNGESTNPVELTDGPQALQALYNMGNFSYERVDDIFRNISDSMTTYMRTAGVAGVSNPATGTVMHYTVCLHVEWAWLAVPAALVSLMVVLFVSVVVVSQGKPVWKDSPLVLMFHGPMDGSWRRLHGISSEDAKQLHTMEGMEEVSKGITVKLDFSRDVARLVPVKDG